jgi:hypothetical protein
MEIFPNHDVVRCEIFMHDKFFMNAFNSNDELGSEESS